MTGKININGKEFDKLPIELIGVQNGSNVEVYAYVGQTTSEVKQPLVRLK